MSHISRRSFVRHLSTAVLASTTLPACQVHAEPIIAINPLRNAMDQAAKCCLAWLNPEQEFLPTGGFDLGHDTGRWWDAMLRYEAATGTRIPARVEDAMLKNVRKLSDNPAALLAAATCQPHNLRESLLAYTELVRHRKDEWALQQGRTLIRTIHELLEKDGQLNHAKLAERMGKPMTKDGLSSQSAPAGEWFNATGTTGRALEAIVWFHEATGDAEALELARRIAETQRRLIIDPTGKERAELADPARVGHTHSYCGTLRGLLLYGFASGDKACVDAVAQTYRHGLWGTSISHSGWTPHDQGKIRFPDKQGDPLGEHASCGDVAQIALWLALRAGQTDLLDDAERLLRARLFPSQIVDPKNPRRDGGWGVYNHPFGQGSILDVFAAVLHSLADFDEHIVATTPEGAVAVHLHFDADTPAATVRSKREKDATLLATLKNASDVRIRVPAWAPRESIRLTVGGKDVAARWDGAYIMLSKAETVGGGEITVRHALPERETEETMPVSKRQFRLKWRGDEVVGCNPAVPIYSART